jgi:hypothetical protein
VTDYGLTLAAILATQGEGVTVTVGGTPYPVTVAWLAPHVGVSFAGVPIDRPEPQVLANAAAWLATGAGPGDTLERGAEVYTIVDPALPDDSGAVLVTLRKYT